MLPQTSPPGGFQFSMKKQFRARGLKVLPVSASVPVTLADHHAVVPRLLAGTGFGFTTFLAGTAWEGKK